MIFNVFFIQNNDDLLLTTPKPSASEPFRARE